MFGHLPGSSSKAWWYRWRAASFRPHSSSSLAQACQAALQQTAGNAWVGSILGGVQLPGHCELNMRWETGSKEAGVVHSWLGLA